MASLVLADTAIRRPAKSFPEANPFPKEGLPDAATADRATRTRRQIGSDPWFDCVRSLLPARVIAAAEQRAARIGVGFERVLIAGGTLSEESYLRALGDELGIAFDALDGFRRAACSLSDDQMVEVLQAGVLPIQDRDDFILVVAPRGATVRRLSRLIKADPAMSRWFRFTTAEYLKRFVLRHAAGALVARSADRLKQRWPELAAGPPRRLTIPVPAAVAGFVTATAALIAPMLTAQSIALLVALLFLSSIGLRVIGALTRVDTPHSAALSEQSLPVYSIICALYREATSVNELLCALEKLDYPPEKLDVILAIEADDHETRAAVNARTTRLPISVITVPTAEPRTKPKALNVALPFARGIFTVIYDAEDRPERDQLRKALAAFRSGGRKLACVQASLCIDNTNDSLLTRLFTAEYAAQFDVVLPGLAGLRLPLPLGGSSNHFRTAILREVGAWDAYNVTEDADLGIRLARFGYRSGTIRSTTYEEATARIGPWLRQRTRWFKGWMQTWLVHMRAPHRLLRDLRLPGFVAFQLIVGGNVLAALVHPFFLLGLVSFFALGGVAWHDQDVGFTVLWIFYGATAAAGYIVSVFLGCLGLLRRRLLSTAWVLALTLFHWPLLSLAAWRAVYQLIRAPYHWEKTEHGLAQSSRRNQDLTRSLLALERYLTELEEKGELPGLADEFKGTSADRQRPLAASGRA
jgi:cellulose synthase/poly-beta-1,6-N-acetylglucosamine synthase-like glycosyltransferase